MSATTPINGGLSTGERLTRIEEAVERGFSSLESKLDTKVGKEVMDGVVSRLDKLESGETPLGKYLIAQFSEIQHQVGELNTHGSRQAQEAERRAGILEGRMTAIETLQTTEKAVMSDRQDRQARTFRLWGTALAIIATGSGILSAIAIIATG